jgi:hypothetical protein
MTPAEVLAELLVGGSKRPASELNATLRAIWPLLHGPQHTHGLRELVELFRRAGYVSDGIPRPNGDLTIYRGELVDHHEPGIAWTTDFQTARSYAQRYASTGHTQVVQSTAPPAAVLARFHQEAEAVVDPDLLKGHKNLGYIPHFVLPLLG